MAGEMLERREECISGEESDKSDQLEGRCGTGEGWKKAQRKLERKQGHSRSTHSPKSKCSLSFPLPKILLFYRPLIFLFSETVVHSTFESRVLGRLIYKICVTFSNFMQ